VERQQGDLIALRHDIHRHPELSGSEERTAGLVAARLSELGFEVRTGVGGHGVIGVLQGTEPGPLVAFRADLDAVRSNDNDPASYRSTIPGVRHICGHDVHTAVGVGLAEAFSAIKNDLAGSVILVFQPAEERGTGAKAMLADGAFVTLMPDAIFALHTAPYDVGTVATIAGAMMAGRARVSVTLRGTGDLWAAASKVRRAIQGVGTFSPDNPGQNAPKGFITVQLFPNDSGTAGSREFVVSGQVMTAGLEDRNRAKNEIVAALEALELSDVGIETQYDERFLEGVTNDDALVELSTGAIHDLVPGVKVREVGGVTPFFSEDYGSFQAVTPGVMYFLGVSNPRKGIVGMPHSPDYVADDAAILVGVQVMLAAMLGRLAAR
jgi:metal-dependent amidase/aminoacylase/carboxypeptidase family protein